MAPMENFTDSVPRLVYADGKLTHYGSNGAVIAVDTVGGTLFDMLGATDQERQASYDSPYYGVLATPDSESGYVCSPTCVLANRAPVSGTALSANSAAGHAMGASNAVLRRPGVRRLVADLAASGTTPEGYRRFRGRRGEDDVTLDVDAALELPRAESVIGPTRTVRTRYEWTLVDGRYIKTRTISEHDEVRDGRHHRSQSVVDIRNVKVSGGRGQ